MQTHKQTPTHLHWNRVWQRKEIERERKRESEHVLGRIPDESKWRLKFEKSNWFSLTHTHTQIRRRRRRRSSATAKRFGLKWSKPSSKQKLQPRKTRETKRVLAKMKESERRIKKGERERKEKMSLRRTGRCVSCWNLFGVWICRIVRINCLARKAKVEESVRLAAQICERWRTNRRKCGRERGRKNVPGRDCWRF